LNPATPPLHVGITWCTQFKRSSWQPWSYWALPDIYRGPSFFAALMVAYGHADIRLVRIDETLELADFDGTRGKIAESVELFYIATHGKFRPPGYSVCLQQTDWWPMQSGLGGSGPKIAVFETCNLVKCDKQSCNQPQCNWTNGVCDAVNVGWMGAGLALRLILGFVGDATIDRASTLRGLAFADNLHQGLPIGDAWLQAVHNTATCNDLGIAIALGDDPAGAQSVLNTTRLGPSLNSLPKRSGTSTYLAWEICH
jgi:hypothetical protein